MIAQIITENGQKKIKPLTADTGAGNPVGTIIVVCSNRVPSNYLPLGTQFDTTLYPVLYALLGTDTTPTASALGLPTLSSGQYAIKATSGLSENAQDNVINTLNEQRSYFTDEIDTGMLWTNGKHIYKKTFSKPITDFPVSTGITNIDEVIKFETTGKDANNYFSLPFYTTNSAGDEYYVGATFNPTSGVFNIETNLSLVNVKSTIFYTKTTD